MQGLFNKFASLIGVFLIYSLSSVLSKCASFFSFLSLRFLVCFACAILFLGIYAVLWQQIIKRIPISDAYMFKGVTIVFVMFFSCLFFGESISLYNCVGAGIIISGIALYAKS